MIIFLFSLSCFIPVKVADNENRTTIESLFKKSPDLIVVFTGDTGRIEKTIELSQKYTQKQIFITGVYSKNTVVGLLKHYQESKQIDPNFIEIDYTANNTLENVISTLRYLRNNQGMKYVLIVSHDYHIFRIKYLMNSIKSPDDKNQFFYYGIKTDYFNFRNIKLLYKETFKIFRIVFFLMFWTSE